MLHGIFGGTFDPIHNGHVETVTDVADRLELGSVRFIPSHIPPHRGQPGASPEQRLDMTRMAVQRDPRFIADNRELERGATSFSYDTVKSLQHEFPLLNYCFILGLDALLGLESWHNWEDLLESVHFVVMTRPGWHEPDPRPHWLQQRHTESVEDLQSSQGGCILYLPVKPNRTSASLIRERIGHRQPIDDLVPRAVADYIAAHRLYAPDPVHQN